MIIEEAIKEKDAEILLFSANVIRFPLPRDIMAKSFDF
jgi:hypothetical protein